MRGERGVTMVELLVVAAVLGLVMAGVYNTFMAQERAYVVQDQVAEMNQNARVALEIMSRHIRNAALDPTKGYTGSGAGARILDPRIYLADTEKTPATTFIFMSDFDADAQCSSDGERIGFWFDAANERIKQCVSSAARDCSDIGHFEDFVDSIQSLQFSYIYEDGESSATVGLPDDGDGDDTNDFDDIREVVVEVVAQRRSDYGGGSPLRALTSRVQIRNLVF